MLLPTQISGNKYLRFRRATTLDFPCSLPFVTSITSNYYLFESVLLAWDFNGNFKFLAAAEVSMSNLVHHPRLSKLLIFYPWLKF